MSNKMKTVDIKGKDYVLVNERVKAFRSAPEFKGWSIQNTFIELTDDKCVIKTEIIDDAGIIRATGFAYEMQSSSYINKTSYIENCETSAVGRALGFLGIGVDTSICSAEELTYALEQQERNESKTQPTNLNDDNKKTINELIQKTCKLRKCTENQVILALEKLLQKPYSDISDDDMVKVMQTLNKTIAEGKK